MGRENEGDSEHLLKLRSGNYTKPQLAARALYRAGELASTYNCDSPVLFYLPVDCEWMPAESGECLPNCGGGIIERYYIITQEAAHGGKDCPPVVRENITEVIECCRKCTPISYLPAFTASYINIIL